MKNLKLSYGLLGTFTIIVAIAPGLAGNPQSAYAAAVLVAILAIMAYGLDVVVSDLGEVSLGHTVFFASGAYTTAIVSTGLGAGSWMTLFASIAVSLVLAAIVGFVTLRLRDFVFSLVTYALAVVTMSLAENWAVLGGSDGIRGIPTLDLSIGALSLTAKDDQQLWPFAFVALALTIYLIDRFRRSRIGIAAFMAHMNPQLATMTGVNTGRARLMVMLFSAPITAVAGWLYAYQRSYVSADILDTYFLILTLTAVILIGRRQLLGPLIGVSLLLLQERFFSFGADVDKILLGSVLVLVLALLPNGLSSLPAILRKRLNRTGHRTTISTTEEKA